MCPLAWSLMTVFDGPYLVVFDTARISKQDFSEGYKQRFIGRLSVRYKKE